MPDRVQVLITIDAEPEPRLLPRDRRTPWLGLEYLMRELPALRQSLRRRTGDDVRFGWYWRLDPQVEDVYGDPGWPLKHYADAVETVLAAGDGCGVHTHAWRWDDAHASWRTDHADQAWVESCVRTSFEAFAAYFGASCRNMGQMLRTTFEAFAAYFGASCRTFRFGDGWINDATLNLIETLGAAIDLTVEPGFPVGNCGQLWEPVSGEGTSTVGVPNYPYRRRSTDGRVPRGSGKDGLWMVPVSTAPVRLRWGGGDAVADETVVDDPTYLRRQRRWRQMQRTLSASWLGRLVRNRAFLRGPIKYLANGCILAAEPLTPRCRVQSLNLAGDPQAYACCFAYALARSGNGFVHTVLRTGDLAVPALRRNFIANIDYLLQHRLANRMTISTPERFVGQWRAAGSARSNRI